MLKSKRTRIGGTATKQNMRGTMRQSFLDRYFPQIMLVGMLIMMGLIVFLVTRNLPVAHRAPRFTRQWQGDAGLITDHQTGKCFMQTDQRATPVEVACQ